MIAAAWAGGRDGRRVIDRVIPQVQQLLRRPINADDLDGADTDDRGGVMYLVTVDDNRPAELAGHLSTLSLEMKPLLRRRARNEALTIQKIMWKEEIHHGKQPSPTENQTETTL